MNNIFNKIAAAFLAIILFTGIAPGSVITISGKATSSTGKFDSANQPSSAAASSSSSLSSSITSSSSISSSLSSVSSIASSSLATSSSSSSLSVSSSSLSSIASVLIGTANWANGSVQPTATYPGTSWNSGTVAGGTFAVVSGALKGTYPIPVGGDYCYLEFYPPAGLTEIFVTFKAKMTNPHAIKFFKVFGVNTAGNYANSTFGLSAGGAMTQTSFGDGTTIANDTQNVINLSGTGTSVGRSPSPVISTPQNSAFTLMGDGNFHTFKIRYKRNSGTTALNEVADGVYYVEIDGLVYVNASGLFNRHYSNGAIERMYWFGYAQDNDYAFDMTIDDVNIYTGAFP